jgi:hypothetical protein
MTSFYWFLLSTLAVWRITHLLAAEDGPGDIVVRLRKLAGNFFWGALLDCFYCLSLWVAVPLALYVGEDWKEKLLLWPALSAGSILLERSTAKHQLQESEDPHVLLRQEETTTSRAARGD